MRGPRAVCGARPGHERQAGTLLGRVAGLQAARPHSRGCRRVSFLMARTALGRVAPAVHGSSAKGLWELCPLFLQHVFKLKLISKRT